MFGHFFSNAISLFAMISPPFLLFFAWKRLLKKDGDHALPKWRSVLAWAALLSVSTLLVTCIVAFFTIPCNVDLGDWSCVDRWRSFTRIVIRTSPLLILLALLGQRGTRILGTLTVLAIDFDCVMVDMMA